MRVRNGMLIVAHGKAAVLSERADNVVSLIDSGEVLEEIIDAYGMSLGQGQ